MSRAGNKAFERCDVGVVEFGDYVYTKGKGKKDVFERGDESGTDKDKMHAGYHATLHCPRTEDDRISVTSEYESDMTKVEALNSLKKLAGELVCRNCRFSSMSPVDVSNERAELARAEAERTEAFTALEQAREELRQYSPHSLPPA